uniref:Pyridoxamine 5'-phosphate oxidase N-terminal domain-containing protein n=1 Tax=Tetradesmus obliquus TaxID=3088 RepID=A0A383VWA5_TETOB|eukprot:jgi/Sobl393_1/14857/SZX69491.1
MGQHWQAINPFARKLISKQHLFFIATAPLSSDGHVNLSPKGHAAETFAIINDNCVAFLDLTGSGVETIAHVRENGRITFMFCNFEDSPCILRLWGKATVHERGTPQFDSLMASAFQAAAGTPNGDGKSSFAAGARSIIVADIHHVASACGYGVPLLEFKSDRDSWVSWAGSKDESAMQQYRMENNATSLDGLAALPAAVKAANGAANGNDKSAAGGAAAAGNSKASSCNCSMVGLLQKAVGEAAAGPLLWLAVGLSAGGVLGVHAARR